MPSSTSPAATLVRRSAAPPRSTAPTAEAGEVIVASAVHARHLGGLAADQRAAGDAAALGDARRRRPTRRLALQLAGREIVEEEQRLGALHDEVVDAHRDQIDADVSCLPVSIASFSLVPTPSFAATSSGSLKPAAFRIEEPPKPPISASAPGRRGGAGERAIAFTKRVAGGDGDACLGVAVRFGLVVLRVHSAALATSRLDFHSQP
jgi:hypothetical protein